MARLKQNNRLSVWSDSEFAISSAADGLFNNSTLEDCLLSQLPYGEQSRKAQTDLFVFDQVNGILRSYEVKRGNGKFDSGKIRSIMRDLVCTHVLLKSYGNFRGHYVGSAESKIIFYYGLRSIPKPLSLVREELDEHFDFPVVAAVEEVNDYFRDRLHELLEAG